MQETNDQKTEKQVEFLFNRLTKKYKHLRKWAKRENINCYRLYNRDIPEIPLSIDIYFTIHNELYVVLFLYERPYEKDELEEEIWLNAMIKCISTVLNIEENQIFTKTRKRQKEGQYEKNIQKEFVITVEEYNSKFLLNLSSYVDTGLFFDHRPLRNIVRSKSKDKRILNLFCYTGSFSVHAAQAGAIHVDSVDLSKTYIAWAKRNFEINNIPINTHRFINDDVFTFLSNDTSTWDIIILDPPTFSNSKKTSTILDINKDYATLINLCTKHLVCGGVLYFSSNSRSLKFDEEIFSSSNVLITEITHKTIPEDFRNTKIHRCWEITKQ